MSQTINEATGSWTRQKCIFLSCTILIYFWVFLNDQREYVIFSAIGLLGAAFLLGSQLFYRWQSNHKDCNLLNYEPYIHGLVAAGFLVTFITMRIFFRYPSDLSITMLLGFFTFSFYAIDARLRINPNSKSEQQFLEIPTDIIEKA